MTLWEIDIYPAAGQPDRLGSAVAGDAADLGLASDLSVTAARGFLVQGKLGAAQANQLARELFADGVVERTVVARAGDPALNQPPNGKPQLLHVMLKPGVMDPVAQSALNAIADFGLEVEAVRTFRKFWLPATSADMVVTLSSRILANDSIEQVVVGPLELDRLQLGSPYEFELKHIAIRELDDEGLTRLSREGQLYLTLVEMQTIQSYFRELGREPTDAELESIAQTWSEHCSHKTLAGRIAYRDENGEQRFENMLKETIFAATQQIRRDLGEDDWCVSVFEDNAGIVRFDDDLHALDRFQYPALIKPNQADGSVGITQDSVVNDSEQAKSYVQRLRRELGHCDVLVQEYLSGAEYGLALIGNPGCGFAELPLLTVDFSELPTDLPPILGYESKTDPNSPYWSAAKIVAANLNTEVAGQLREHAIRLFRRLGCQDYARFDWRVRGDGALALLEVNPNPAWDADAKLAHVTRLAGQDYPQVFQMILDAAQTRLAR